MKRLCYAIILFVWLSAFVSGCSCDPILYKPTIQVPIASLCQAKLETPETLSALSSMVISAHRFDYTVFDRSRNKNRKDERLSDNRTEHLGFFRGIDGSKSLGTWCSFALYDDHAFASRDHQIQKGSPPGVNTPVFLEDTCGAVEYYISYVKQERSDRAAFCVPLSYYVSEAGLKIGNLVIWLRAEDDHRDSRAIVDSIDYVVRMLTAQSN